MNWFLCLLRIILRVWHLEVFHFFLTLKAKPHSIKVMLEATFYWQLLTPNTFVMFNKIKIVQEAHKKRKFIKKNKEREILCFFCLFIKHHELSYWLYAKEYVSFLLIRTFYLITEYQMNIKKYLCTISTT